MCSVSHQVKKITSKSENRVDYSLVSLNFSSIFFIIKDAAMKIEHGIKIAPAATAVYVPVFGSSFKIPGTNESSKIINPKIPTIVAISIIF